MNVRRAVARQVAERPWLGRATARVAAARRAVRGPARDRLRVAPRRAEAPGIVGHFDAGDVRLPIHADYRYRHKPAWYAGLGDVVRLDRRGMLTPEESAFVRRAKGTRTLNEPVERLRAILPEVAARRPDDFVDPDGEHPILRRSRDETEARIEQLLLRRVDLLREVGVDLPSAGRRPRLLEIGYSNGGHSLVAFERMGFEVTGIDNYYDGKIEPGPLPRHIVHELAGARARLVVGDAGDPQALADEQFDVVFSESVLEHLRDPDAVFANLRRLLRPGGVMVHTYQPFFCELGAHTRGLLDCPYGHVRIPPEAHLRYLEQERPNEAELAVPWVRDALNRWTQRQFQRSITAQGFVLADWIAARAPDGALDDTIVNEAFAAYPQIDLADLATTGVVVVAR